MINFGLSVSLGSFENFTVLREWRNDPKIWRWTRQNDLISETQQNDWFEKQKHDTSIKMYGLYHSLQNEKSNDLVLIGICGLTSISFLNRNAEFSLYIAPPYQGKGLSEDSLLTLFYHGFKNMGLHLIWGETFSNNKARLIFNKIGMTEEGHRQDFYFKDGKYWDAILFSITENDFLKKHGDKSCFI